MDNAAAVTHTSYRNPWKDDTNDCFVSSRLLVQIIAKSRVIETLCLDIYLCVHGSNLTMPFKSKHKVHESSRTLSLRNCSRNKWRGRTILSWSFRYACELKLSNERLFGGYLNGSEPKLKRHCWNDIQEAAAKNPSLCKEKDIDYFVQLVQTLTL